MLLLFLLIFFLLFCHQLNSISTDSLPSSANANLNSLLSDVTTKARPTGFYNSTTLIGHTQLYGLALCRADLSVPSHDCSSCLTNASSSLTTRCSNKKWGTIWYEKCLLRYSNDSFFGVVDDGGKSYCGVEKVSSAIGMATVKLAKSLVAVAANSKLMFAANESAVGDGSQSQTSYVLLQCTRDLSSGECETCLKKGMGMVTSNCTQTNGWRYLSGSCTIRYENYAFFNTSVIGLGELPVPQPALPTWKTDTNKRSQLDWTRRHGIVAGISRGLLYLHEDSLLKIIHRDLKASNVLLDNQMNPKISDFGMAKILGTDESASETGRVVGTLGYMAPEYALDGIFSVKSDVYSFGVLLLEILTGKKNGRSHFDQHGQTLLRRAWELWQGDRAIELMDPLLGDSYPPNEAIKLIHIGLLCVQENADERPTMSTVFLMQQSEQMVLPQPTQPPTFFRNRTLESNSTSRRTTSSTQRHSINEVTITDVDPR